MNWRSMSAAELIWLYHVETYEYLASERKSQVRKYLTDTGDFLRLTAWDQQQIKEAD